MVSIRARSIGRRFVTEPEKVDYFQACVHVSARTFYRLWAAKGLIYIGRYDALLKEAVIWEWQMFRVHQCLVHGERFLACRKQKKERKRISDRKM